jgi:hypothetical protein
MTPFCMFGEWKPLSPAPLGEPAYAIRKINMIAGGEFNLLSGQNVTPGGSLARVRWHAPQLRQNCTEGGGRGRLAGAGCRGRSPLRPVMARTSIIIPSRTTSLTPRRQDAMARFELQGPPPNVHGRSAPVRPCTPHDGGCPKVPVHWRWAPSERTE